MKLKDAIDIGKGCGLDTVEECVENIEIHAISLFSYDVITKELNELKNEYKAYKELK